MKYFNIFHSPLHHKKKKIFHTHFTGVYQIQLLRGHFPIWKIIRKTCTVTVTIQYSEIFERFRYSHVYVRANVPSVIYLPRHILETTLKTFLRAKFPNGFHWRYEWNRFSTCVTDSNVFTQMSANKNSVIFFFTRWAYGIARHGPVISSGSQPLSKCEFARVQETYGDRKGRSINSRTQTDRCGPSGPFRAGRRVPSSCERFVWICRSHAWRGHDAQKSRCTHKKSIIVRTLRDNVRRVPLGLYKFITWQTDHRDAPWVSLYPHPFVSPLFFPTNTSRYTVIE